MNRRRIGMASMSVILGLTLGLSLSSCVSDPPQRVEPISTSGQTEHSVSEKAEKGRRIFNGKGVCSTCHGENADGRTSLRVERCLAARAPA